MTLKQLIENVNYPEDWGRTINVVGDYLIIGAQPTSTTPVKRIEDYDKDKEFFEERY